MHDFMELSSSQAVYKRHETPGNVLQESGMQEHQYSQLCLSFHSDSRRQWRLYKSVICDKMERQCIRNEHLYCTIQQGLWWVNTYWMD